MVLSLLADDSALIATLTKDKSLLDTFAAQDPKAKLGGDSSPLLSTIAGAQAQLLDFAKTVSDAKLGANAAPFWSDIANLKAEVAAMSPLDVNVDANVSSALAQLAAIKAAFGSVQIGQLVTAGMGAGGGGSGGGGDAAALAALAGAAGGGDSGGSGGSSGLLAKLLWGGLGGGALAGIGSLGSLAGFGGADLLGTGAGVAGSIGGGLLGGGLLGLGSLGVGAVGMGTDMAGIGQAAGDIKSVYTALAQGPAAVNTALQGFSSIARGAVLSAAQTAQAFHQMFNAATGEAEKVGAQILQQAMQVGEQFLPMIGQFAAQNMGIIQKDIQPLFSWMTSMAGSGKGFVSNLMGGGQVGGMAIFQNLEQIFQNNLPAAMSAINQGMQLFAKTVDIAAQYAGPLVGKISDFLTKMNGASFGSWSKGVQDLIGLFQTWMGLAVSVGKFLLDLVKPAVGLGKGIALALTGIFNQLGQWLSGPTMQKLLSQVFGVDFQEIIGGVGGVITALLPLLETFAQAFLQIEVALRPVVTALLQTLAPAISTLVKALSPVIGMVAQVVVALVQALAPAFLALVKAVMPVVTSVVGTLAPALVQLGPPLTQLAKTIGAFLVQAVQTAAPFLATLAKSVVKILDAVLPLLPQVFELARILLQTLGPAVLFLLGVSETYASFVVTVLAGAITVAMGAVNGLAKAFTTAWQAITVAWQTINSAVSTGVDAIVRFFTGLPGKVVAALSGFGNDLLQVGKTALKDMSDGITTAAVDVWNFFTSLPGKVIGFLAGLAGKLLSAGHSAIDGLLFGITSTATAVWNWFKSLPGAIGNLFSGAVNWLVGAGEQIVNGLIHGIENASGGILRAITAPLSHIPGASAVLGAIGLASGGLVTKPTFALVGEAGPELVLPLSLLQQMRGQVTALSGLSGLPAQSPLGAPGAGGVTITNTFTVNAPSGSTADITRSLSTLLEQHDRQLVAALRAGTAT